MISLYPAAADPNVYKAYIVTRLFKGKHTAVETLFSFRQGVVGRTIYRPETYGG